MAQKVILIAAVVLAATIVDRAFAQAKPGTAKPPAATAKTTLSSIYTAQQAQQGEDIYYSLCVSCHPKGYYTGPSFKKNWGGRPLSDLYDWVLNKMPKNDPGSLTPAESVQVIAYILQQNKMPAGKEALPANMNSLYRIKIQLR